MSGLHTDDKHIDAGITHAPIEQIREQVVVAEGTGKTAEAEGAQTKVVHNVRSWPCPVLSVDNTR
jgi:hypothetical protein